VRRGTLGALLVGWGILGLALVVIGAVVGLDAAARIERLTASVDETLERAATTTRTAADAFASADAGLEDAEASVESAASLAADASSTLRSLAGAMELSIFGAQPLVALADDFESSADQAESLSGALGDAAGSLGTTRTDVAAVGVEMAFLADDLEDLRATGGGGSPPVRLFVGLLLAWLAIPAVGAIVAGVAMRRPPATTVVVTTPAVAGGTSVGALEDAAQPDE
jgi:hypothetical protein